MADRHLPGLIVCGEDGAVPYTCCPARRCCGSLSRRISRTIRRWPGCWVTRQPMSCVGGLAPARCGRSSAAKDVDELPVVDGDATSLEVAAVMARMHSPLVAVVDGGRRRSDHREPAARGSAYRPADAAS